MLVKPNEIPVLIVNVLNIVVFGGLSVARLNYEFVIYALVIIVFFGLVIASQRRVQFPPFILWGLTLWGFLHMAGGHIPAGGARLYDLVLMPVVTKGQETILRYDHLVHFIGFGVSTLVCFHLLRPYLAQRVRSRAVLSVLVALMGMGLGAFNEVVELVVVLAAPESGVGGYYNTAFDLLFNMLGSGAAVVLLNARGDLTLQEQSESPRSRLRPPADRTRPHSGHE